MGVAATVKSYVDVNANDYEGVMNALANVGPLAVNVDASQWHLYENGVFDGCSMTQNVCFCFCFCFIFIHLLKKYSSFNNNNNTD